MAKDNWSGGAGWKAISDPTGVLTGRVLVTTAGITQYSEDYMYTLAGTTSTFTASNYAVIMNYAFPSYVSTTTFSGASMGLVSRASALTTTTPTKADDCYIGRISPKDGVAEIVRRNSGVDTVLASAILPSSTWAFSKLHTMRLNTYGTTPVTLQFLVNDEPLVSVGDSSSSALTTGYSGIQMQGGTSYVDNYTILEYTSSGGSGYNGALPSAFYDTAVGTTSSFMVMWLKGDVGLTERLVGSTKFITNWYDQADTLASSYSLLQGTTSNQPERSPDGFGLNGIPYVRFDKDKSNFLQGAIDSGLDINGAGHGDGVAVFYMIRFYNTVIGDPLNSTSGINQMHAPLGSYGRSYSFSSDNETVSPPPTKNMGFSNNSNSENRDDMYTVNDWQIMCYTSGSAGGTYNGFFLNGTQVGSSGSAYTPTNFDMSDASRLFMLGRRPFLFTDEDYMYGTYDVAEMLLVNVAQSGISDAIRQKTEGYLAHKFNLSSLLPASHPYKNNPPS